MRDTGHINSLPTFLLRMFLNVEDIVITDITDMSKGTVEQPKQGLLCGYIERFIESGSNCQGFLCRCDYFDPNNRNKWMKYKEQAKPCRKFLIHTRCWVNNSEILLILKQESRNRENSEWLLKIRDFDPYPSACDD